MDPFQKVDEAANAAEALASQLVPLLQKVRAGLKTNHDKTLTASYILLVAAAGFFTEEMNKKGIPRKLSAPMIRDIAEAVAQDLVPGHDF